MQASDGSFKSSTQRRRAFMAKDGAPQFPLKEAETIDIDYVAGAGDDVIDD
jgi:hypothetical protein